MMNIGQAEMQGGLLGASQTRSDISSPKGNGERFDSVLKSTIASNQVGGKAPIKADNSRQVLEASSLEKSEANRPDFMIMNNNIIKHSVKDTKSEEEESEKQVSWIMSVLISQFVTEADIKRIMPKDLGSIEAMEGAISELEELLNNKAASGEMESVGSNIAGLDPKALLKDLQEMLAKNNVSLEKIINPEEFKQILAAAKELGIKTQGMYQPTDTEENENAAETLNSAADVKTSENIKIPALQTYLQNVANQANLMADANTVDGKDGQNKNAKTLFSSVASQILTEEGDEANVSETLKNTATTKGDTEKIFQSLKEEVKDNSSKNTAIVDDKNKTIKEAAEVSSKEKNSTVRLNPDAVGTAINKSILQDNKIEVRGSMRNEAAANLEIFKVKNESAANNGKGSGENPLDLLKTKNGTSFATKTNSAANSESFKTYLEEGIAQTKDMTVSTKDTAQTYDMKEPKDVSRLLKTLESMAAGTKGESRLTVSLNPEHLGRLEIRLIETGGKLTARFFTDNETSHKMMVAHGEVIRNQLAEKGIVIENMDFGFKDATAGRDNGEGRRSSKSNSGRKNFKDDDTELDGISVENNIERNAKNNAVYA